MKKYSIGSKTLAMCLAVLFLICLGVSVVVTGVMAGNGVFDCESFEDWQKMRCKEAASRISYAVADAYAATLSDCPRWVLEQSGYWTTPEEVKESYGGAWNFRAADELGRTVWEDSSAKLKNSLEVTFPRTLSYPILKEDGGDVWQHYDTGEQVRTTIRQHHNYQVTVCIDMDSVPDATILPTEQARQAFDLRYFSVVMVFVFLGLFGGTFVYLMRAAGRRPEGDEIKPAGLNRIPLDIYGVVTVYGGYLGIQPVGHLFNLLVDTGWVNGLNILFLCMTVVGVMLLPLGFATAVAAQVKCKMWWRNSILGRCWEYIWKGICFVFRAIGKLFAMLPVIWEWLLIAFGMLLSLLIICAYHASWHTVTLLLVWLLIFTGLAAYGGWCFGTIRKGVKRMAQGDLTQQISTDKLFGAFKATAEELNTLQDAAHRSAQKQLRSERMKAELITNVSHDIKTPLTSLINYVDLLQKPHTPEAERQYLEVLARQSEQMKKLLDDLMEMSKASTGNLSVVLEELDACEAMNQALGEYADKLAHAHLAPVLTVPESPVAMVADGRLTWRVLGNLMSNTVKYALPGTRVYLAVQETEDSVILSVKNISKEPLNMDADELMERFVRGDASRNTEGSGLGLNIAQSLMTLQRGRLELTVDGDLFKAELHFPKA